MEPEKNDNLDPSQDAVAVEPREPWEKLPQESQKAFGAFVLYRDDEKRSFKNVAEKLNCSAQNVFQWSSKYNWKLRCDAWDVEQDRAQRAEFARGRVRMRERHMAVARAMLHVAGHALREWADQIEQRLPLIWRRSRSRCSRSARPSLSIARSARRKTTSTRKSSSASADTRTSSSTRMRSVAGTKASCISTATRSSRAHTRVTLTVE